MKVLMFGWEFAPMFSGGLGIVSAALTKALSKKGVGVTFVVPKKKGALKTHVNLLSAEDFAGSVKVRNVDSVLAPYINYTQYKEIKQHIHKKGSDALYGDNLFDEVYRYSEAAKEIAEEEDFDVIHAHDWMTYQAGINAKKVKHKPLVLHIHATEFDRTGGNGVNPYVYDVERKGFHAADKVIAVSNYTKNVLVNKYDVSPEKIEVVHNAIEPEPAPTSSRLPTSDKTVLFLGRVTLQKGPDYFMDVAKKISEVDNNVSFVIAGNGDMQYRMIEKAAHMGLADKVFFTGAVGREDAMRLYKMADVYVMPSVSEPFGITPLESIQNGTPVVVSKNAGVTEVMPHMFMVDFWDINETANKVVGLLNYSPLSESMTHNAQQHISSLTWDAAADKCLKVYEGVMMKE